ncbi:MAG: type II pantothenate kinase [Clostridia bacterium]|nr:type II pantothenate kinase [Clostridia bacterium]
MQVVIGIDVGGSTTKIVGFRENKGGTPSLMSPLFVRATDPVTSIYGAFGRFVAENGLSLLDIKKVMMTGVGSSHITKPLYDLPCEAVSEFRSIGLGGLYLSGLSDALVVSLGTGTAIVHAKAGCEPKYLGGTGVGGGTLMGLSKKMLGIEQIEHLETLAEGGDLSNIDLRISDVSRRMPDMPTDLTASNFGKLSDIASGKDVALGIINMVFETVAMVSLFAARSIGVKDIVLLGNLTSVRYAREIFPTLSRIFDVNFIIPENSQFGTVIGTALCG